MALGRMITVAEKFWSSDNHAKYSHSGIIINPAGSTMEALWTVDYDNIFSKYKGCDVLICRHKYMGVGQYKRGFNGVKKHVGQIYPFWRLVFCLVPPVSKYVGFGRLVCSELVGKFLYKSGMNDFKQFQGLTPDHIADRTRKWKDWNVIFEGKI